MSGSRLLGALPVLGLLLLMAIGLIEDVMGQGKRHRRRSKPVAVNAVPDTSGVFVGDPNDLSKWRRTDRPADIPGRITAFDSREPVNKNLKP